MQQSSGSRGVYVLEYIRSKLSELNGYSMFANMPKTGEASEAKFPNLERTVWSKWLESDSAERKSVPVVNFNLLLMRVCADQFASPAQQPAWIWWTKDDARMLCRSAKSWRCLVRTWAQDRILICPLFLFLRSKQNLDASLATSRCRVEPSSRRSFDRLQKQQCCIQREKTQPVQMGLRCCRKSYTELIRVVLHSLVPFWKTSSEDDRDDIVKFYQDVDQPNIARWLLSAICTMNDLKPRLEKLFGGWKVQKCRRRILAAVSCRRIEVYLLDKPGAQQSIFFQQIDGTVRMIRTALAIEAMNTILAVLLPRALIWIARVNIGLRFWQFRVWCTRTAAVHCLWVLWQTDKQKNRWWNWTRNFATFLGHIQLLPMNGEVQSNMDAWAPGPGKPITQLSVLLPNGSFRYSDDYFETFVKKSKFKSW